MSKRRRLKFDGPDAVVADVQRLRSGCDKIGNWTLAQTCWHLEKAIRRSMRPGPYDPPVKGPLPWILRKVILKGGRVPRGVRAPQWITPTGDETDASIDEFLKSLEELKNFRGPFAPHPRLGLLSDSQYIRFHMIHSAHHLGFHAPTIGQ